jgi:Tol biopolymer transport system component
LIPAAPAVVPARLVVATVRAAGAGTAPARVAVLVEGALRTMMLTRLRIAAAIVVVLSAVGLCAGLLAQGGATDPPADAAPAAAGEEPAKKLAPGHIYAAVVFPPNLIRFFSGSNPTRIVAIDPETGKWTKIGDAGSVVRVSPDGRALAYLKDSEELWLSDTRGEQKPARLAEKAGRPNWSPDGKQLVHTKGEVVADDGWKTETRRLDADGTGATKLPVPDTDFVEDWSADGKWFVTCSDRHPPRGHGYQLYVMHPDGSGERRLTKGRGLNCYARFSPDGKRIAYLHQERGVNSVHVMDADGTKDREILVEKDRVTPEYVCWSPDGKRLALTLITRPRPGATDLLGNPLHETVRIETLDADGGNRKELKLLDAEGTAMQIQNVGHPDWR